jgi:predicted lipoprotein with Yx(FWY)xxD motif
MRSKRGLGAVGAITLMATLAACGSSGSSGESSGESSGGSTPAAASTAATSAAQKGTSGRATLSVVKTSLGSVVAGPDGRTVYMFAKDTKGSGKSTCSGACLSAWPPVTATGTPKTSGITGTVGTITTADGKKQVTLGGRPLYYFAGDSSTGDVSGQGVNGFGAKWWALRSNGTEVTKAAGHSDSGGKGGYSY